MEGPRLLVRAFSWDARLRAGNNHQHPTRTGGIPQDASDQSGPLLLGPGAPGVGIHPGLDPGDAWRTPERGRSGGGPLPLQTGHHLQGGFLVGDESACIEREKPVSTGKVSYEAGSYSTTESAHGSAKGCPAKLLKPPRAWWPPSSRLAYPARARLCIRAIPSMAWWTP